MKLMSLILIGYISILLLVLLVTIVFVKLLFFDQKTAYIVMDMALILTSTLLLLNYFIMRPLFLTILELQAASKKNSGGDFTTINRLAYTLEVKDLVNDYNQMVNQLEWQMIELKYMEKEKGEIISNLSHDIKTPVSSLMVLGQALFDEILSDNESKYYLDAVITNCQRISDLSDELFQIADSNNVYFEPCNVKIWVDEILIKVLNSFKGKINNSKHEVKIQGTENVRYIITDESVIYRVLYNIIDNSLKYSPKCTPLIIKITQNSKYYRIGIQDFGNGISHLEQKKIFLRTYRVEKSRNASTGGHGLGLAIAKKLLENINGNISVTSQLGVGSTFWIDILKGETSDYL